MAPLLQMIGASAGISIILQRYVPQYPVGIVLSTVLLFFLQFTALQTWNIVVYPRFFSPLRHLPTPPGGKFFTGQTGRVMKESSGMPMRDWTENVPNDGLIRYSMWFEERVLLTNPKVLSEVLVTKNYDFIKPKHFRSALGRTLGIGILLAEGEEHKTQRKNLMPAFAFRHIKDLYPLFWSKSREMTDCLAEASKDTTSQRPTSAEKTDSPVQDEEKAETEPQHAPGVIDVGNFSSRATLDIIGLTGMGRDFDSLHDQNNKLNQTYRIMFNPGRVGRIMQLLGIFLPFWLIKRLPVKRNADLNGASVYIKDQCRDMIAKKRAKMSKKERTDVDIISVALESGGFTDEDLVNQMMVCSLKPWLRGARPFQIMY